MPEPHPPPLLSHRLVWVALIVLLVLTMGADALGLGLVVSLAIALAKAALIVAYFMELRVGSPLVKLAAWSAAVMLAVLFGLTLTDYATRTIGQVEVPEAVR